MEFLKEKDMKFRLKNLEVRTDFAIWKSWDKRNEEIKDVAGNIMKFPIRDGVLTNNKGVIKDVNDISFMPMNDFKEQYPDYKKGFQFIRQIIIGDVEYSYTFSLTANKRLKDKIADLKLVGKDPLKVEFEQLFDKSKSPADMYSIKIIAVDLPEAKISKTTASGREYEIIEAIRNRIGKDCTKERFIDIMNKNDITEQIATELYKEYNKHIV